MNFSIPTQPTTYIPIQGNKQTHRHFPQNFHTHVGYQSPTKGNRPLTLLSLTPPETRTTPLHPNYTPATPPLPLPNRHLQANPPKQSLPSPSIPRPTKPRSPEVQPLASSHLCTLIPDSLAITMKKRTMAVSPRETSLTAPHFVRSCSLAGLAHCLTLFVRRV
ncbi:hypothetical protein E2C01_037962 [Portunus trituberculatus]|uniref:Uncharacterized protein n=1 Tax=Portunus trituberculatus TaxID=210409 RepID=A0A5B7F9J3_PORTR|nr:hypothetical protein [Portunus trituberculatus]